MNKNMLATLYVHDHVQLLFFSFIYTIHNFSVLVLHDIVAGGVLDCWQHFVLACRKRVTRTVSTDNVKLGDTLFL